MPRETLAERVRTPEFAAAVARARARLDAEEAGWVVMEPKRAKALLAVARAADRWADTAQMETRFPAVENALVRALSRLRRVSAGRARGKGKGAGR